jgi:hypothetical protein
MARTAKKITRLDTAELCLQLMRADSEEEVITLLEGAGYWDDPAGDWPGLDPNPILC